MVGDDVWEYQFSEYQEAPSYPKLTLFKLCGFERVQVCGPVSDGMKEMAKEMPFPFELYDHLHDGRFGKLK